MTISAVDVRLNRGISRRRLLQTAGALAVYPMWPSLAAPAPARLTGRTMGTGYRVNIGRVPDGVYLPRLKRTIERVLVNTEELMSVHRSASELSGFNASRETSWHRVSVDTARVVAAALQVQGQSGGAFNAASAPLLNHWGFGPGLPSGRGAPDRVPDEILMRVASAGIEARPGLIRKAEPRAALDLNGIAKGDALDRVALVLDAAEVRDYLVEIGGEIRVAGTGPAGDGWRVGIDNPAGLRRVVRLGRGAVATSGDHIDFFIEGGKRYCHIVDPRVGRPVAHGLSLVSVVADSAMLADAWATALLVMGPDAGWAYAVNHTMAAWFMVRRDTGFEHFATPAFDRLVLSPG